ncbi:MAG: TRAP transporter small permease [Rhizobiaceae bacterium]|nr:TRAP transporter small permease [Rhizobiaceae bacterium]
MNGAKLVFARGLEYLALAMAALSTLSMAAIVAIIVTSVTMRRLANTPLHLTEDVVGLMLSTALFLALPLVTLRSQHIRVTIVLDALGPRFRTPMRIAALLVGLGFFGWIVWVSIPWFEFAWLRNLKTETARILLYPWMAALPLSLAAVWLIFFGRLVGLLEPEHAPVRDDISDITSGGER